MNPRNGQIYSLDPLRALRERTTEKVSILDYTFNFVPFVSASSASFPGSLSYPSISLAPLKRDV